MSTESNRNNLADQAAKQAAQCLQILRLIPVLIPIKDMPLVYSHQEIRVAQEQGFKKKKKKAQDWFINDRRKVFIFSIETQKNWTILFTSRASQSENCPKQPIGLSPFELLYGKPFLTVDLPIDEGCNALLNYSLEGWLIP